MNQSTLSRTVNELVNLQSERKDIASREGLLKARLAEEGLGTYTGALGTATVFEKAGGSKLNAKQLLARLVELLGRDEALELIAECTTDGKPTMQCKVTPAPSLSKAA